MSKKLERIYISTFALDSIMNEIEKIQRVKGNVVSIDIIYEEKEKCWCCHPGNLYLDIFDVNGKRLYSGVKSVYCPKCGNEL